MIKTFSMKNLYLTLWLVTILPCFAFADTTDSLTITNYYPAPYGEYNTLRLFPDSGNPGCNREGTLFYSDGTIVNPPGLYYCKGVDGWQRMGGGGPWTLVSNYLYTTNSSVPPADPNPKWNVGIGTTTPNATLQVNIPLGSGSISRKGTTLIGTKSDTHINLGVNSTTGPEDDKGYCTVSGGFNNTASNDDSVVSGGLNNRAEGGNSVVSGGMENVVPANGEGSLVSGGKGNVAASPGSAVLGGNNNIISGDHSAIAGGYNNQIGDRSTQFIPGGAKNKVKGGSSFAAGYMASAITESGGACGGTFVWHDSTTPAQENYLPGSAYSIFYVQATGGVYFSGEPWCFTPEPFDVAEFMDILKSDAVQETELVALREEYKLGKTTTSYDKNLIGVISSKKTATIHLGNTEPNFRNTQRMPVALIGPVYVKVNLQNGKINAGDPITSSSTPGIGMKASKPGKIIGYAMQAEDFQDNQIKEILVFVNVGYYVPKQTFKELEEVEALEKELQEIKQQLVKLNR